MSAPGPLGARRGAAVPASRHGPGARRRRARGPGQRGVAALEFALVMPAFLLLVLFTCNAGFVLYARFLALSLAHTAARQCAQTLPNTDASVQSCASTFVSANLAPYTLTSLCTNGPQVSVNSGASGTGIANGGLHLLTVGIVCQPRFLPIVNILGLVWTTPLTVSGLAAVPFLIKQPLPLVPPGH